MIIKIIIIIIIIVIIIIIIIIIIKTLEFMVNNYVNFIIIIYDKRLLEFNYIKWYAFVLVYCSLYIIYTTICFNTFEALFFHIFHIF